MVLGLTSCGSSGAAPGSSLGTAAARAEVSSSSTSSIPTTSETATDGGISLLNRPITGPNQLLSASVLSGSPAASSVVQTSVMSGGTLVGVSADGQTLVNLPLADELGGSMAGAPNAALVGGPLTEVAGVIVKAPGILAGQSSGGFLPDLAGEGAPGNGASILTPLLNVPLSLASTAGDQSASLRATPLSTLNEVSTGTNETGTPALGGLLTPVTGLVGSTLNGTLNGVTKTLDGILPK